MRFELEQVLAMVENLLKKHPNRSDFEELKKSKEELERMLQEYNSKCEFCKDPCGNEYCITKESK